jgi:predicted dehydrogenase
MNRSQSFSRRHFIQSILAAGAAPLILPGSVWSAEVAPSEKLTLGFIGMGTQARGLMRGFIGRSDTKVVAVCDVDKTRREAGKASVDTYYSEKIAGGGAKSCEAYGDFRELLARKDIDGVVIATPDHWHAIIAVTAADAKKDIYCEKPMSHTILEARAMVDATRRNKRVFQVGSMQRSSTEFRVACELVRNGALGKISHVDVAVGGPARPCNLPMEPDEPGLNWNMWLGAAPMRPYNSALSPRGVHTHFPNWRNYREYGGGGVTDWGAHHWDIAHWGLGFDDSGPVEIIPAKEPNASSGVVLRYAGGVEIRHVNGNGTTFFGEKGKIYVNRGKFEVWLGGVQKAEDKSACDQMLKELLPANPVRLYNSQNHLGDWINSMRTRKAPICDVEVGAHTIIACSLVNLAYYHGQKMSWDPKAEKFTNNTGDPKWLTKEYRAPWKLA